MSTTDAEFIKAFYQQLRDRELDPVEDKDVYVPIYTRQAGSPSDPVDELQYTIESEPLESAQLFTGFRGTGKSTELRRLQRRLEASGCVVVRRDMRDYVNMNAALDVSDFLLAVAGAFGDGLADDPVMKDHELVREGYWTRFYNFLTRTKVDVSGLGFTVGAPTLKAELKASLQTDPTVKKRIQDRLKGHLAALVNDVHSFFKECILAIRERHKDPTLRVVMIIDSIEHLEGLSSNHSDYLEVARSIERVFQNAHALKIPYLHVIYTIPPWLKIRAPGIAALYNGSQLIPCIKVLHEHGGPCTEGLDKLERIIARRGDWRRLLGDDRAALNQLLIHSGGYLRDLLRLMQAVVRRARHDPLPASEEVRAYALDDLRNDYFPITNNDARWLCRIEETHTTQLDDQDRLGDLARLYNNHLVLTYRNGHEWVAVHPLIVHQVKRQVAELDEAAARADKPAS